MSDFDDYFDDDGDLDWLYVEDAYDEADDLAEHACPSPAWDAFVPADDYDPYDYFEDLNYLSDGHYDEEPRKTSCKKTAAGAVTTEPSDETNSNDNQSKKRKRPPPSSKQQKPSKRSRTDTDTQSTGPGPVAWLPRNHRMLDPWADAPQVQPGTLPAVALFKDWRSRFANAKGLGGRATQEQTKESDADVPPKYETEAGDDDEGMDESGPSGAPIELSDLSAVASLLSEEQMTGLRAAMAAKGLDPEAMEVVLADLLAGREPDFGDDDEEDDGEDEHEAAPSSSPNIRPAKPESSSSKPAAPAPDSKTVTATTSPSQSKTKSKPQSQAKAPPKSSKKRKLDAVHDEDDDGHNADETADADEKEAPAATRSKRAKPAPKPASAAKSAVDAEVPAPPLTKTTRSGKKRK